MRRKSLVFLGLGFLVVFGLAWRPAPPSQCRSANPWTAYVKGFLDTLLTHTDSLQTSLRQKLNLAQTTPNQIKLVTKAQTCANAAQAVDALAGTPNSGRLVWVFQIGQNYAASDSTQDRRPVPGQMLDFFSNNFTHRSSTIVMPPEAIQP
jgi:hypothetical protein